MSEEAKVEAKRRVFQALSPDHTPTQLVTYMSEGGTDKDGFKRGPESIVIDRNRAGQFILRSDARHYDAQLKALRQICKSKPHFLREVGADAENKLPEGWKPNKTPAEVIQDMAREKAENSDQIRNLQKGSEEKDQIIADLTRRIQELENKRK